MRKRVMTACLVGIVGLAAADPKSDQEKTRQQAIEEARKAGILGPKPGPEFAALTKVMAGEWTCTGDLVAPTGAVKMTGRMMNVVALDGRWLHESMEVSVPPSTHVGFEAYITYDAGPKKWRRIEVDSVGNHTISSAVPTTTGKLEWLSDEINADGKLDQQRTHFDGSDPKKLHVVGEATADKGKTWTKTAELTCTR
jgi:hypothetical protein